MSTEEYLSEGSLDIILEQSNDRLHPIVQILGTKMMANNRLRSVIFDGQRTCQHCIFVSDQLDQLYRENQLDKFTIARLEQYTVSSLPKKENLPVILVNRLTILKPGPEVGRKLNSGESFTIGNSSTINNENVGSSDFTPKPTPTAPQNVLTPQNNSFKAENVCPINVLTPFFNAWVIRVRVTNKSALRTYSNKKGDGKLFNFDVCDESGEIRITAFNAECDKFFNLIEKDSVYYISKGSIKPANKKFSSVNNDYEITLNQYSVIEHCNDASIAMPKLRFKFANLVDINNLSAGTVVDVIGVIRSVGAADTIISKKSSKELTKKEIQIVDKSLAEARVTVWNEAATDFKGEIGQIIAFKGVIVGEFMGKTLSSGQSSLIQLEPEIPETHLLRSWYDTQGKNETFASLSKGGEVGRVSSNYRFIGQITSKSLTPGNTQNFSFVGMIQSTNRSNNHLYKSCGFNGCQKKVTDDNNGLYYCSKCDRTSPTCTWRLMLNLLLSDSTGNVWVTVFQENGEKLLGKNAEELAILYENDQNEYLNVINTIRFKRYFFRIYTRTEEYNSEMRLRSTVSGINPLAPVDRATRLMTMIDSLSEQISV